MQGTRGLGASIILGLLAALLYGAANFAVRPACERAGIFRTMLYGQWLAAPFLTLAILAHGVPQAPLRIWCALALSDLLLLAATGLVCRALSRGAHQHRSTNRRILWRRECPSFRPRRRSPRSFAVDRRRIDHAGCVLAAGRGEQAPDAQDRESGTVPAAGAALLFGMAYWVQGRQVTPTLGAWAPVWLLYPWWRTALMPLAARTRGISLEVPSPIAFGWIGATTVLAVAAYLALTAGLATAFPLIASVLSTLSSALTVVLGQAILKERGTTRSWRGLVAITAWLLMLRAPSDVRLHSRNFSVMLHLPSMGVS